MLEYWWIIIPTLLGGLDIVSVIARLEMYKDLKYISDDQINEVSLSLYARLCTYLIPDDDIIKFTNKFPLTYLFDRKVKNILKDKTYEGEPVLDRLDVLKSIKWKDIKDKAIFAVLPKEDRDKVMKILSEGR